MKYFILIGLIGVLSCQAKNQAAEKVTTSQQMEIWKDEVRQTESDFAAMASEKGVPTAFLHFAADHAVLNRDNMLIKGKATIENYFQEQTLSEVKLNWKPEFVDVSTSGDLAYTYGEFTFSAKNPDGEAIESGGIFHTVWKRQADGSWKYVWD